MNAYIKKLHNNMAKERAQGQEKIKSPFEDGLTPERKESPPTEESQ